MRYKGIGSPGAAAAVHHLVINGGHDIMTPKELAIQLLRLINERDPQSAITLFAPEAELCFPRHAPRSVYRGSVELREFFDWLVANLPMQTVAADRVHESANSATVEFETAG